MRSKQSKHDNKKKKFKKMDENKQKFPYSVGQDFQRNDRKLKKQKSKDDKKQKRQRKLYADYLSLEDIEKSRKEEEKLYYKGRIEYG